MLKDVRNILRERLILVTAPAGKVGVIIIEYNGACHRHYCSLYVTITGPERKRHGCVVKAVKVMDSGSRGCGFDSWFRQ